MKSESENNINYSNHVNIHYYCNTIVYLHKFRQSGTSPFYAILCKFYHFLYFSMADAIALRNKNQIPTKKGGKASFNLVKKEVRSKDEEECRFNKASMTLLESL